MKTSIIIPNYNGEKFISDTLNSVIGQTISDWECIIIDDASTDKSVSIIQEFCKSDNRFRLISQDKHRGVSATRNVGLNAASGDWIAFLDSDDLWMPDALEIFLNAAEKTDAPIIETGVLFIPHDAQYIPGGRSMAARDSEILTLSRMNDLMHMFYLRDDEVFKMPWVWRRIWRRDIIGNVRFDETVKNQNEDLLFVLDIYHRAPRISVLLTALVMHRAYSTSTSSAKWTSDQISNYDTVLTHLHDVLKNYSDDFVKWCQQDYINGIIDAVILSIKTNRNRYAIANSLAQVYHTDVFPHKYLTLRQRIIIKLFIMIFSTGTTK